MLVFGWVEGGGFGYLEDAVTWKLLLRLYRSVQQESARAEWLHWRLWR